MALVLDVLALDKHLSAAMSLNNSDTYRNIAIHPARRPQLRQRRQHRRQPVSHFNHRRLLSVDTSPQSTDVDLLELLRRHRCRVVKRIPKVVRVHAADKLERLLSVVCEDPDNIVRWNNLLLSTLASKINKRIWDFPKTIIFEDQKIDVIPLPSKRSQESSKLAATVSNKLEDGDVRGAFRLTASDDTLAPFTDATLEEQKLKHPPRAVNTQLQLMLPRRAHSRTV